MERAPARRAFDADVAGIAALADPVRRELYRHVCAQTGPVGRDAAAAAVGITRHQAKFHLDRLEADGLLVADYVRLTGRTGPGAGRPAKVYRRAEREIAVSLPQREYELAGGIMADAIDESMQTSLPVAQTIRTTAAARGQAIAEEARARIADGAAQPVGTSRPAAPEHGLDTVLAVLAERGYEPRWESGRVVMANCPFHALVHTHTELVCTMNHAFITAITDELAPGTVCACLEPDENRCCVTLREAGAGGVSAQAG
ncbi:helix-turn-helix domain-containing protein [Intrasporangium sp.]|uniref:helix-turn-helix transcriptional regulator n=1 Tax=Intrasporangium sp. TaxID=1925024 RepID=UPI0032220827